MLLLQADVSAQSRCADNYLGSSKYIDTLAQAFPDFEPTRMVEWRREGNQR